LIVVRQMRTLIRVSCFFVAILFSSGQSGSAGPVNSTGASARSPVIVIGFVGGFVRHGDLAHSGVQIAARLRGEYPSGVYVEAFENDRGKEAHQKILKLLDTRSDGKLSTEAKQDARILIYGHSWGGSEAITLARELGRDGIPVLLTIQVDSVAKMGEDDTIIPPNVAQAVNFYQLDGLLHGQPRIRAADAARTQIIGNFRTEYKDNPIQCIGYPWYASLFMRPHIEIECDPHVWNQVESLIRSRLSLPAVSGSVQRSIP
jgi:hypothetical protein